MKPLFDYEIYQSFTTIYLPKAENFVWIATANIKNTTLQYKGQFIPFVDLMAILAARGVSFRIIHSEIPSNPFRTRYEQLDSKGLLSAAVEFLHCIRMHSKVFIVDGEYALVGSANLTGAGIGAKSANKRNFEIGFVFEGREESEMFLEYFDYIWMGGHCKQCGQKHICPAPIV
jgi:phosphatidylserine/phosphatidylglycerophosphate/cardiolipin synthase-like enzyme